MHARLENEGITSIVINTFWFIVLTNATFVIVVDLNTIFGIFSYDASKI